MYSIIFENNDFLVVDKNPEIDFHTNGETLGLAAQLKKDFPMANTLPVHRLDKATSGLIIFAKGRENAAKFSALIREQKIEKYYIAISDSKPNKKQGSIIGDMERTRSGNWKLLRSKKNPAITSFFSKGMGKKGLRIFLIRLYTGKTHQIRVALKSISSPIIGDARYYKRSVSDRMYLAAYSLRFSFKDKKYDFKVIPEIGKLFKKPSFLNMLELFGNPEDLKWPR